VGLDSTFWICSFPLGIQLLRVALLLVFSHVLEFMRTLALNTFFQLGRGRPVVYELLINRLPPSNTTICLLCSVTMFVLSVPDRHLAVYK